MSVFPTEQEGFWAGSFGDEYSLRNVGRDLLAGNVALFSRVFSRTSRVSSVLELGSNIGLNLKAAGIVLPAADLAAVEINTRAVRELESWSHGRVRVFAQSILEFKPQQQWDFVFTKGVLIHINPDRLPDVYDIMYQASARYLFLAEYYSPSPVMIPYRGNEDRLFKRDFAGEIMDRHRGLRLVEYGFVYHRDNVFPQDDLTWFLMEKVGAEA